MGLHRVNATEAVLSTKVGYTSGLYTWQQAELGEGGRAQCVP